MARRSSKELVELWLNRIEGARRRPAWKDFIKEGELAEEIYKGCKKDETPFNILYSNTETLQPSLYSATPRPTVDRRFKTDDPIGFMVAKVAQRLLEYLIDSNSDRYQDFDSCVEGAVLDSLLSGRGALRVKYDAKVDDGLVDYEAVCFQHIKWQSLVLPRARHWSDLPWLCFEHHLSLPDASKLLGSATAAKLTYTWKAKESDREEQEDGDEQEAYGIKTAHIYEVWDKTSRTVIFLSPSYKDSALREDSDPLKLTGFFPMPAPLRFLRRSADLDAKSPYQLYERQARELNRLTIRIARVAEAIKVRGGYNSQLKELEKILREDDNALVPITNVSALAQSGGLDKHIWLLPIEKLMAVLQQLLLAREQAKQTIYEITGIADIMRGASKASETLGAQQIKAQWGTLRLKRMQQDVQKFSRSALRIALEVAVETLSLETIMQITGLQLPTREQEALAMQEAVLRGQPTPRMVTWEQVHQVLKTDVLRQYKVDVETNSTIDLEATEDREQAVEAMNAMGQFLNAAGPAVANGQLPFDGMKNILLAILRRFRFGKEVEETISTMQPQQRENPELQKMAEQVQGVQQELQRAQQEKFQLSAALEKSQASQTLSERAAKLDMRELTLKVREEMLSQDGERRKLEQDKFMLEVDSTIGAHRREVEKLTTTALQGVERSTQAAKQVGGVPQRVAQEVKTQLNDLQRQQAEIGTTVSQLIESVQQLMKVAMAPKRAVRGADGRIERVEVDL